jgi:hypothetical protein
MTGAKNYPASLGAQRSNPALSPDAQAWIAPSPRSSQ